MMGTGDWVEERIMVSVGWLRGWIGGVRGAELAQTRHLDLQAGIDSVCGGCGKRVRLCVGKSGREAR